MSELISDSYLTLCKSLHSTNPLWGNGPASHLHRILDFTREHRPSSVIDYGCGKGKLSEVDTRSRYQNYDPAVELFSKRPSPAPALVSIDVLEHVEPEALDAVLEDIANLTTHRCLLIISTIPAKETLADGRNAHLTLHDYPWWVAKLSQTFRIKKMEVDPTYVVFEAIPLRLYRDREMNVQVTVGNM